MIGFACKGVFEKRQPQHLGFASEFVDSCLAEIMQRFCWEFAKSLQCICRQFCVEIVQSGQSLAESLQTIQAEIMLSYLKDTSESLQTVIAETLQLELL